VLPAILTDIPEAAFVFLLIDPKGWRIPLRTLRPMLARPHSEVIFNFMFDFINRAAGIDDSMAGLNELMPYYVVGDGACHRLREFGNSAAPSLMTRTGLLSC
jgi:hypothetical protein